MARRKPERSRLLPAGDDMRSEPHSEACGAAVAWSGEDLFAVLHTLRLKGLASEDQLSAATGLPADAIRARVDAMTARGLLVRRSGIVSGLTLSPQGRAEHAELLLRLPRGELLSGMYDEFKPLNREFKGLCTAWQIRDGGAPNDHSDVDYDSAVLARLRGVHVRVVDLLARLNPAAGRFQLYRERLDAALERLCGGQTTALLSPLSDSYHDIWMELHQDLRLLLGPGAIAADLVAGSEG
jgi:hypothetical protein